MGRHPRLDRRILILTAVLLLAAGAVRLATYRSSSAVTVTKPVFGVLQADPRWLKADTAAGLRLAMVNVYWNEWEPAEGRFDHRYARQVKHTLDQYRAAGWQVAVDIGLQTPPRWVLRLPSGALTDQNGTRSGADFEFSQQVRAVADRYISEVVHALGTIQYYRVGLSDHGEAKYPDVSGDGWWAFDPTAQGGAPGLPPDVGVTPMPGWVPGNASYHGRPVTAREVATWYGWYFGALVNADGWEISAYRSAGYTGELELVVPGTGATPAIYDYRIAHGLAPAPAMDSYRTMNTGSVWWKLLAELPDLKGVVVDISSVYDQSGIPRGNLCMPADRRVNFTTSRQPYTWSDTRWLTYLAGLHHLPVMGENPGNTPSSDLPGIMALVRSCGLSALQWAFEPQLHGGTYTSLDQLGRAIADFRSKEHR